MAGKLNRRQMQGFTLLELIVVISILGMITGMATEYYLVSSNQQRHETTVQRVAEVRRAILGDTRHTLNGEAMLSGFVVDVGRLPDSLQALLQPGYCDVSDQTQLYLTQQSCNDKGYSWQDLRDDGWKGPYLEATGYEVFSDALGSEYEQPVFRDGWGTVNAQPAEDFLNSGWLFQRVSLNDQGTPERGDDQWVAAQYGNNIQLQSLGLDGLAGTRSEAGTPEQAYEKEYPALSGTTMPLVTEPSFAGGGIQLVVQNQLSVGAALCISWEGQATGSLALTGEQALAPLAIYSPPAGQGPAAPVQGFINFSATFDSDGDCSTDDAADYDGHILLLPSASMAVHPAVPGSRLFIALGRNGQVYMP